jgi:hypothetical protein
MDWIKAPCALATRQAETGEKGAQKFESKKAPPAGSQVPGSGHS